MRYIRRRLELSDWMGMRYFTHVGDVMRQTIPYEY